MRTPLRPLAAIAASALILLGAGCSDDGGDSASDGAGRTIDVVMTDNAFSPTRLDVAAGETVTLRFENQGLVEHEAVLGDDSAQDAHHTEMMSRSTGDQMSDRQMNHDEADSSDEVTVEPGGSGSLTHRFDGAGTLLIGCHEPGHWEDGMKATIQIG